MLIRRNDCGQAQLPQYLSNRACEGLAPEILNLLGELAQTSTLIFITTPAVGKFAVSELEERQTDGSTQVV